MAQTGTRAWESACVFQGARVARVLLSRAAMRHFVVVLAGLATMAAACGGSVSSEGLVAPDTVGAGAPATAAAAKADSGSDDKGAQKDEASNVEIPPDGGACQKSDSPSLQTVSLVVKNETVVDQYLITEGTLCDELAVTPVGQSKALPLRLGFQCLCECPNPGSPRPARLHRLGAGDKATLTWDARALTACSNSIDCASRGWPGGGKAQELVASYAPVTSMALEAKVAAVTALPAGCTSADGTEFSCLSGFGPWGGPSSLPGPIQELCPGTKTATARFTLGAATAITVPLSLK